MINFIGIYKKSVFGTGNADLLQNPSLNDFQKAKFIIERQTK
jgi:hypothetical protein